MSDETKSALREALHAHLSDEAGGPVFLDGYLLTVAFSSVDGVQMLSSIGDEEMRATTALGLNEWGYQKARDMAFDLIEPPDDDD